MIRAVIYDLDGTLYNKRGLICRMVIRNPRYIRRMLAERRSRAELKGCQFDSPESFYDDFFSRIAQKCAVGKADIKKWYFETYMRSIVEILRRSYKAYSWVLPELATFREQGVKLAVYSDYGFAGEKLRAIGLNDNLFDIVAEAPSFGALKPSARPLHALASALGVENSEILIKGDRIDTDGEGARRCGMQFQLVGKR